jgi:hypothetical protein
MDAKRIAQRIVLGLFVCLGLVTLPTTTQAANFRTQNFLVQAPTPQLAQAVGEAAETYRRELAVYWLGGPIPTWPTPCPVRVIAGPNLAAQGVTTYNRAPVRDFQMEVVGTPERILDSVLPHEVTHTILATHFGRPLPRWADEGICTTVEHEAERNKHEIKLREFLSSQRGIAMNRLFLLTEYPNDVLPLYAQGYSVCRFLIEQKGPRPFIAFLSDFMSHPSWTDNVRRHYGYESLAELQQYWLSWVGQGSGPVAQFAKNGSKTSAPQGLVAAANVRQPPSLATDRLGDSEESVAALDVDSGQGWYVRQRMTGKVNPTDGQLAGNLPVSKPREILATPIAEREPGIDRSTNPVPPSVRRGGYYSAAQPQDEQPYSGSAMLPQNLNSSSVWR